MLTELCRIQGKPNLISEFDGNWKSWISKLKKTVMNCQSKEINKIFPNLNGDINDTCGKYTIHDWEILVQHDYFFFNNDAKHFFSFLVSYVTVKLLCVMPYILKDHKIKPTFEKLFIFAPVSWCWLYGTCTCVLS